MGFNVAKLLKFTGLAPECTSRLLTPVNSSKAVSLFPCALKQECPFLSEGIGESSEVLTEVLRKRIGLPKPLQSMQKALDNGLEPFRANHFISYSEKIEALGKKHIAESIEEIRNILPDHLKGCVGGRGKGQISTLDKLCNDFADKNIVDYNSALRAVDDLAGVRIVLKDLSQMDTLTDSLATGIRKGDLVITELRNYRGRFNGEYFNEAQITKLSEAVIDRYKTLKAAGEPLDDVPQILKVINNNDKSFKNSGYTTTQMKVLHKNGTLGELQIRGEKINEFAEFEHLPYDLRTSKDLSRGYGELEEVYSPLERAVKNLNPAQQEKYEEYLSATYKYYRNVENGIPSAAIADGMTPIAQQKFYKQNSFNPFEYQVGQKPQLPQGFDPVLSEESLKSLHDQAEIVKKQLKAQGKKL